MDSARLALRSVPAREVQGFVEAVAVTAEGAEGRRFAPGGQGARAMRAETNSLAAWERRLGDGRSVWLGLLAG